METCDDDDGAAQEATQPQPPPVHHEMQLDVAIHNVKTLSKLCAEITQSDDMHISKESIDSSKLGLFDIFTRAKQDNDWFESSKCILYPSGNDKTDVNPLLNKVKYTICIHFSYFPFS